ncbi:MAG: DUF1538 family protein [Kiritimatiellae bacterium]|nr:DUF1538 family protein [Kiritimatiellia bacterium]
MSKTRVQIPFSVILRMIGDYAGDRLRKQLKAVAFIVIYLVAFQMLVFGRAPEQSLRMAGGIGLVVLGLTLFLEGLLLGLMPLAQRVGIQLSARGGLKTILPIGFLVGLGATFAEPAVAALRVVGSDVIAWEAPLLFLLLQQKPEWLIAAIAVGVGVAVSIGLLRFYLGFSIKPSILTITGVLLPLSFVASRLPNLASILGLAWDAGAVTTGAVTVPLVLALGIGISRSSGKAEGAVSGFGTVALASAFPVLAVIVLGAMLLPYVPSPGGEHEFFAPENREQAVYLFGSEDSLKRYAFEHGSDDTRALFSIKTEDGDQLELGDAPAGSHNTTPFHAILRAELAYAAQAVLPLTAFLVIVLLLLLRERPRYIDEVLLGVVFVLVGMCLFTTGNRIGLSQLGNEVGSRLPQVYRDVQVEKGQIAIGHFDPSVLVPAVDRDGSKIDVFHLLDGESVQVVKFHPEWHDPDRQIYTHRVQTSPLTHPELSRVGVLLILLFAFGVGYGSTVAEPALSALARTVEDLSVGTITSSSIVRAVSIGVGFGLIAGVTRILYDIPMIWMILPPYLLLFPLTLVNDEDFAGIAWDSGGVVTGLVTVPLVLAMGLGLSGQLDISDGFGILAMASVCPIISVLLFGLVARLHQRKVARAAEGVNDNV